MISDLRSDGFIKPPRILHRIAPKQIVLIDRICLWTASRDLDTILGCGLRASTPPRPSLRAEAELS
eukprot:6071392-Prymnesium_polylepis.1